MSDELQAFEAALTAERKLFEEQQRKRKEDFVTQLVAKRKAEKAAAAAAAGTPTPAAAAAPAPAPAPAEVPAKVDEKPETCGVGNTPQAGKASKCSGCSNQASCSSGASKGESGGCGSGCGCGVAGTAQAGKADKCSGCPSKGSCSSGGGSAAKDTSAEEIGSRMSLVAHKVLVLSGKGGVGKSMLSSQLAFALADKGFFVGLLDIDICGPTIPKMVGQRGKPVLSLPTGLEPVRVNENLVCMSIGFVVENDTEAVIWRGPRKMGLIQTFLKDVNWGPLDFLIVDTPPGTSDEHLSVVQMLKSTGIDGAVVITTPQDVSVVEVGKEINFCQRMEIPVIGVVENFGSFVCPSCSGVTHIWPATSGGGLKLAADHDVPFLGRIPLDPALSRCGEAGLPFLAPTSPAYGALSDIAQKVVAACDV